MEYLLESERSEVVSSGKAGRGNEENKAMVNRKWMTNRKETVMIKQNIKQEDGTSRMNTLVSLEEE